jgi:1,4-alpha-glucan branching enzyme
MTQQGWGYSAPNLDTAALYAIAFQYGTNQDFDVWIDDLAFYAE